MIQAPLGEIRLRSDGKSLTGLWFVGQVNDAKDNSGIEIKDDLPIFEQVETWLESYFSGEQTPIKIPLQPKGTMFQERVWKILQEIPYGETMTYGEIAQRIAKEKGVATLLRSSSRSSRWKKSNQYSHSMSSSAREKWGINRICRWSS